MESSTLTKVQVKLYAQESIDGKTWKFVRDASGNALDFFGPRRPVTGTSYDSDPFFDWAVMPPNEDFSPLVRYGLQVQNEDYDTTPTPPAKISQVYARVTCELEITTSEPFTIKTEGSRADPGGSGDTVNDDWTIDISTAQTISVTVVDSGGATGLVAAVQ